MGARVAPTPGPSAQRLSDRSAVSDYGSALHSKNRPAREAGSLPLSRGDDGAKPPDDAGRRLKDVGDRGTLITAAELGLVQQYRDLKLAGQDILQTDFPYRYSSILYGCYGNQYKILQLVEREFCPGGQRELIRFHTTRCWVGKNSAMVAAYQGHLETLLYIVDLDLQGKFGDVDLFKQRDIMGKTAMDWAASQGHTDTLEVLLVRSLYKLLPADSTDPRVLRTRWKLVSLLSELGRHCRDYDPGSDRRFFEEVLRAIPYSRSVAAAAEAAAARADQTGGDDGGGGDVISFGGGGGAVDRARGPGRGSLKMAADIDDSWDDSSDEEGCTGVLHPRQRGAGVVSGIGAASGRLVGCGGTAGAGGCGGGAGGGGAAAAATATARSSRSSSRSSRSGQGGAEGVGGGGGAGGAAAAAAIGPAGAGRHGSESMLVRPSGAPKDVHITVGMLLDVITSAHNAGINCMGVIMYIQALLQQARYFDDLAARCSSWEVQLLDTCRNKTEVQAVLTPTDADPSEPVGYALATFDKTFLSHKYVQQVFTEKWDTMGVTDYINSLYGLVTGALCLALAFGGWCVVCPTLIVLRSFFSPVEQFLQRGKVIVDSRFPWHVPMFRWMLAQCCLLAFVVLLSYRVFADGSEATLSSAVSPINTLLAVWCVAMLVDEAQEFVEEGRSAYMASGWNIMDVSMSTAFLLQYLMRIGIVAGGGSHNINALLVVNDLLAAAALMAWFRVVSVFELSSSIGPLIQMMKQMLLQDVTRFALLVVVILLGFTVGMEALFKDVCLEVNDNNECVRYTSWAYPWQKDGLIGGMTFLQYVALGNTQVTDFEQKRVTGIIFYLIFAVVTSILMLNLFIAMLADTYTRVSTKAQVEFRYRKAVIMASFSRREAICPPLNLLHLAAGALGNGLRRLVFGRGGFSAVRLRKNEDTPLFPWYFPQGEELADVQDTQRRVVGDFLRSVRVALVKDRLQGDLPLLMRHLLAHQRDALEVPLCGRPTASAAAAAAAGRQDPIE